MRILKYLVRIAFFCKQETIIKRVSELNIHACGNWKVEVKLCNGQRVKNPIFICGFMFLLNLLASQVSDWNKILGQPQALDEACCP